MGITCSGRDTPMMMLLAFLTLALVTTAQAEPRPQPQSADQRWLSAGLQQQPDESLLRARPEHEAARGAAGGRRVPAGLLVEPNERLLHRDAALAVVSAVSLS
jgi:hypothetical protein